MSRRKLLGNVELLGLGDFGGEISPLWGTIIGGGVAGASSMILGNAANGTIAQNRSLYGFLAGLGSAGILYAMPSTRKATFGAVVGAFLGAGMQWLEGALLGTTQLPTAVAQTAAAVAAVAPAIAASAATGTPVPPAAAQTINGLGMARISALNGPNMREQANGTFLTGLGIPKVKYLNGLGIPSIAAQPQSRGTIPGVAGPSGPAFAGTQMGARSPVNLLGGPSTRSNQISLMGGPQIHGLSAAYGATLLGGHQ